MALKQGAPCGLNWSGARGRRVWMGRARSRRSQGPEERDMSSRAMPSPKCARRPVVDTIIGEAPAKIGSRSSHAAGRNRRNAQSDYGPAFSVEVRRDGNQRVVKQIRCDNR